MEFLTNSCYDWTVLSSISWVDPLYSSQTPYRLCYCWYHKISTRFQREETPHTIICIIDNYQLNNLHSRNDFNIECATSTIIILKTDCIVLQLTIFAFALARIQLDKHLQWTTKIIKWNSYFSRDGKSTCSKPRAGLGKMSCPPPAHPSKQLVTLWPVSKSPERLRLHYIIFVVPSSNT